MSRRIFSRVDRQVSILLGVVLFLSSFAIYLVSTEIFRQSMVQTLVNRVSNIHHYIDAHVTTDSFIEVNTKDDMRKESYIRLKDEMTNVRNLTDIRYLYTVKRAADGTLIYVVDGLPESSADFRYPGDAIEPEIQEDLDRALKGTVVLPDRILDTDWGHIFIAYYPLHDTENKKVVGAIGIELPAEIEYQTFAKLRQAVSITCAGFFLLALVSSLLIFRRISNPLYRDLSNTDMMTGLKNRNAFETDRHNLNVSGRAVDYTVLVIDLNNLKLANDRLGHDMGDRCIMEAAKAIRSVEGHGVTGYRFGGDEFVLFVSRDADAADLARRVKTAFEPFGKTVEVPVSLAMGWASFDGAQDRELSDTQKRADSAMYKDKLQIKARDRENGWTSDR